MKKNLIHEGHEGTRRKEEIKIRPRTFTDKKADFLLTRNEDIKVFLLVKAL